MIITNEAVKEFLPHRYPFLFVDSIESITGYSEEKIDRKNLVGIETLANYRTHKDHVIFEGHFPGDPILPGVVQVEMMAQVSSFALFRAYPNAAELKMDVALLSVSHAKFRKRVGPEEDLVIKTVCTKIRGAFMESDCEVYRKDELISQTTIMATVNLL